MRHVNWRPPESSETADGLVVRRYRENDAAALHEAVCSSVDHLRPWMAWIAQEPRSLEQRTSLIREWNAAWDGGREFPMGIFNGSGCVGSTGLHLRGDEGTVEIGYWVAAAHAGRGVATSVVKQLCSVAEVLDGIRSVEIVTDVANERSGAVAARCGFRVVEEFTVEPMAPAESGHRLRWARDFGQG